MCVNGVFFFKQKTAYEMLRSLVGSEMCIRDRSWPEGEEIVLCNLRYRAAPDISADALGYRAELALASDVGGASFPVSFMAPSGAWEAAAVENGAIALVAFAEPPPPLFRRGDANDSGRVDIADAIFVLGYLFAEAPAPVCPDAADANDDGRLDIADAVRILAYLFAGASLPPPGAQACGVDPTAVSYTHLTLPTIYSV